MTLTYMGTTRPTDLRVHFDATLSGMVPTRELWLWQNPEALAAVQLGLEQISRGEAVYLGSFGECVDSTDD